MEEGIQLWILDNCDFQHKNLKKIFQENGRRGDQFMRQIEPIAAYVPYMTCPGNHENAQ